MGVVGRDLARGIGNTMPGGLWRGLEQVVSVQLGFWCDLGSFVPLRFIRNYLDTAGQERAEE